MPYWQSAFNWTRKNTKTFTPIKTVASIIIGLVQAKRGKLQMNQALDTAGITIIVYVGLYALEFGSNLLFRAPAAIMSELTGKLTSANRKIVELGAELSKKRPIDAHREGQVREWLAEYSESEKGFLRWLLDHSPAHHDLLTNSGFSNQVIEGAAKKGRSVGLIVDEGSGLGWTMRVQPNFVEALTNLLHPY